MTEHRPEPQKGIAATSGGKQTLLRSLLCLTVSGLAAQAAEPEAIATAESIENILVDHCFDCHGDGMDKGGVELDSLIEGASGPETVELWARVLRNVRAGIMPPIDKPQPDHEQKELLATWIKSSVFQIDPADPDPGRVTVRRLNRVEYRNSIRDLIGVDFDTETEFPADDTGHGFDNIGDVLTISPMLLEKYLDAAQSIVNEAVPTAPMVVAEERLPGADFRMEGGLGSAESLSYYETSRAVARHSVEHPGDYQLVVDMRAVEQYVDNQFDYNKCRLVFRVDGEVMLEREFVREGAKPFQFVFDRTWEAGSHEMAFEILPLTPEAEQIRSLRLRVEGVTVRGPMAPEFWVRPDGYESFFPDEVPDLEAGKSQYARRLLVDFASRAFRRPVDDATADRLTELASSVYSQSGKTFEAGVAQAMVAVLASPRFLFREETPVPHLPTERYPLIDEYSLASRLSYFLWSTMPDQALLDLAGEGRLRENRSAQVERMLADPKADDFIASFTGQWLQARDIETVSINSFAVARRDEKPDPETERARDTFRRLRRIPDEERTEEQAAELAEARRIFFASFRRNRPNLNGGLRRAMRQETEMHFAHVLKNDLSLLELIDSDYTFVNEDLAKHYGVEGVEGDEMRRIDLPEGSPRGGVLTQGTVLAVTSNPTRTSPVKRGVFILENILGTPPAPPPPNIPALEDVASDEELRNMTLRETLALHREQPLCSSCHDRMDPLGLALEHFNAMGMWRDEEAGNPIDVHGRLITGEDFATIQELKKILVTEHADDIYHCISEKMLTYALGRALDHLDVFTLDQLVESLESSGGRPSSLITGIIESAPFQKMRSPGRKSLSANLQSSTNVENPIP